MRTRILLALVACLAATPIAGKDLMSLMGVTNKMKTAYIGIGDVEAQKVYWGFRAYSAATAGTKSANICNSGDASCADVNTLANGDFDKTTAQGAPLNCGGAGGTCTVKTLYDKVGTACSGTVCDLTQATAANRATLSFTCVGGAKVCMVGSGGASVRYQSANATASFAQPFSIGVGAIRQGLTGAGRYGSLLVNDAGNSGFFFGNNVNLFDYFLTTDHTAAQTDNAWHALQAIVNGASSTLNADGTTASVSIGATALTSDHLNTLNDAGGDACQCSVVEIFVANGARSAGTQTAIQGNMAGYWGF
jgi:hypothetical protein